MSPRPVHEDDQSIVLRRGTFLVLWDVLQRILHDTEARKEVAPNNYEITFHVDEAERRAMNWLTGALERSLPEIWSGELEQLIAKEKVRIMSRPK